VNNSSNSLKGLAQPFTAAASLACACCAGPGSGGAVSAPSNPASPSLVGAGDAARSTDPDGPVACGKPWKLDVIGGDAQVVVVCAGDVQRRALDAWSAIVRALSPALDPARERVCACVGRVPPPAFVDLVLTAQPEEGRVTVQAGAGDDLDPDLGPAFVACVGTVVVMFGPLPSEACADAGKASFVYPVRLELGRGSSENVPR
jgi:hypothetical protein